MVTCKDSEYRTADEVRRDYPNAFKIVKTMAGWAVFATEDEYKQWRSRKW